MFRRQGWTDGCSHRTSVTVLHVLRLAQVKGIDRLVAGRVGEHETNEGNVEQRICITGRKTLGNREWSMAT